MDKNRLRIAVQRNGRLAEKSIQLLTRCGLDFAASKDRLFCFGRNLPVDLMLVRDDDIPGLMAQGVCDVGIVGKNVALEYMAVNEISPATLPQREALGFGQCRLAIAAMNDFDYRATSDLEGKTIATTYPALLSGYLRERNVSANLTVLSGSVEIAPRLGAAEFICDLVSTGTTLEANGLKEVETILESEACIYSRILSGLPDKADLLERILTRVHATLKVDESKYVVFHAPKQALDTIEAILPGAESPTILPLAEKGDKVAVHALCRETVFWEHLEQLKEAGASAILVLPIDKIMN